MGFVGITLENEYRPLKEATQLTRLEALEVLPNPSLVNNNLDVNKLLK